MKIPTENHHDQKHRFETHEPGQCPDEGRCMFCDGGLGYCTVCGGFEGTLTTECPGVKTTEAQQDLVYKAKLDFKDGQWVEKMSIHWEGFKKEGL